MKGKSPADTALTAAKVMLPQHANPSGNVHGGVIMREIDSVAGVVAGRHCGSNTVTASIDRLDFFHPVYVGDVLLLSASLNFVGRTSMEVGVRVEAENPRAGTRRHTASAYLTFVALDRQGKPTAAPPLILRSAEEERRNREAGQRRRLRLAERATERAGQKKG